MRPNQQKSFTRDDGTIVICATDAQGRRLPTRYVRPDGIEAQVAPPVKKPPRRIEPKRTDRPAKASKPKRKCKHLGERRTNRVGQPDTLKVLCTTCQGVNDIQQPVFDCAVYGRCLPSFQPKGEARDRWYGDEAQGIEPRFESGMYHLCTGCKSRELVEIASAAKR